MHDNTVCSQKKLLHSASFKRRRSIEKQRAYSHRSGQLRADRINENDIIIFFYFWQRYPLLLGDLGRDSLRESGTRSGAAYYGARAADWRRLSRCVTSTAGAAAATRGLCKTGGYQVSTTGVTRVASSNTTANNNISMQQ